MDQLGTNIDKPLSARAACLSTFLLAMCVLMLEVSLTRVFSVMTYHHFTYLIIGLALLGFGAAGSLLTVHPAFAEKTVKPALLIKCAWLFSLATLLGFLCTTKTNFDVMEIHLHRDWSQVFGLFMLLAFAATPFFFGGICLGYLLSKGGERISRLYFFDLVGAGIGSLLALFAINYLGATFTIFGVAAIAALIAIAIARSHARGLHWPSVFTFVIAAGLAAVTLIRPNFVPVPIPDSKIPNHRATDFRWHVVARVDVLPEDQEYLSFGGALSRTWDKTHPPVSYMGMYQDGAAFTGIVKLQDSDPTKEALLGHYMQGAAYMLRSEAKALVIGPGGGVDMAIALHYGAKPTGVDINPWTIDYVKDKFNDFAGGLYRRPDVELICAEGRHYLTRTDRKFDVIQLSGVDTFTALASGAYALSENYLYTVEAMNDYFNHLSDDGILGFSRWVFTPPRESIRLAVTARRALELRGIQDAQHHIMVLAAPGWFDREPWAETLIKLAPFTQPEVEWLRAWAERLQFDIIYDPFVPYQEGGIYDAIEGTKDYGPAVCARDFDKAMRLKGDEFASFIANHRYNITPTVDDQPFFFNFYRLAELKNPFRATLGGDIVNRLPLGLVILIVSAVQIMLLGGLCIALPLRKRQAKIPRNRATFCTLIYFAAIGLAFIAIEIMVMQKLMVFVGGPVYAMSITLFSLLVFCGFGSELSRHILPDRFRARAILVLLLLCMTSIGTVYILNAFVPHWMYLSHFFRCMVAIAVQIPIAILMGMPFPTGMRLAELYHPQLPAWGWCVNACATVFGTVMSMALAMFVGFTMVMYVGAAIYAVALIAASLFPPKSSYPT